MEKMHTQIRPLVHIQLHMFTEGCKMSSSCLTMHTHTRLLKQCNIWQWINNVVSAPTLIQVSFPTVPLLFYSKQL